MSSAVHQAKEVSLFPGLREEGGTTACTTQTNADKSRMTNGANINSSWSRATKLGRKGPESKAKFWHHHCRAGHRPRGHGVCWRAAPGRPLSTAENGMPTRWKEIPLSLHVSWRLRAQQIHTDSLECQREKCSLHSQPFIEDKSPLSLHNQRLWKKELTKIKAWG